MAIAFEYSPVQSSWETHLGVIHKVLKGTQQAKVLKEERGGVSAPKSAVIA